MQSASTQSAAPTTTAPQVGITERRGPSSTLRGIRVSGTMLVGSGVSIAPGPTGALATRSPALLTVDAGFFHPELTWLEFAPTMLLEMERSVSFGVAFRMRAFVPLRRFRPYALIGAPVWVPPKKLLGAQVGVGAAIMLHRNFALAAEFGPTVFFAGDDLTEGGALTKIDGSLGLRVSF